MDDKVIQNIFPRRQNLRLTSYDYSGQGSYFITICTRNKQILFGQIVDNMMKLNPFGDIIESVWKGIPHHYTEINNDIFIVMPDHVHGIITIYEGKRAGSKPAPTRTLSEIVRAFKTCSSRRINELRNSPGTSVWQRNYYEHVIRNENDYLEIRKNGYIRF